MTSSEEDRARKGNFLPNMERRKVIKGIAATAGIICARPRILALGQDQASKEKPSFALPIRGIANKGGKLVQPIQLTIAHAGTEATWSYAPTIKKSNVAFCIPGHIRSTSSSIRLKQPGKCLSTMKSPASRIRPRFA